MWRDLETLFFLAAFVYLFSLVGCGSVTVDPNDSVADGGAAVRQSEQDGDKALSDVPAVPADAGVTLDSGPDVIEDAGPSCVQRCAEWCARGKEGSVIGCGCGC